MPHNIFHSIFHKFHLLYAYSYEGLPAWMKLVVVYVVSSALGSSCYQIVLERSIKKEVCLLLVVF